jgi:hypothetical protein
MKDTLCLECGGISMLYQGYKVDICAKCAKERINRYFRGGE